MALYRLSQRFRRRFKSKEADNKQDKDSLEFKVVLLDETDLTFYLHKKSKGQVLLDLVFKNLDLVEKDYFGLQFMDTHQVSHWLDPTKKIKKQVKIGPPYTLHFRVKFYAADPQDLGEELTRYHFFLQLKQDIARKKLEVPQKMAIELVAYSLQSQLGDYEPELHGSDYMEEFKFYPYQNKELEKEIIKKHKSLVGLNPAECEVNFLRLIKKLDYYGINLHKVQGTNRVEFQLGLTPRGISVIRESEQVAFYFWPKITKMTFKKKQFILEVHEDQKHHETYHYLTPSSQAAKHLWKCAIEHHTFFRLIKSSNRPKRTSSFLRFGSRFRYSGRTEYQTQRDARMSSRKAMKFKRASSERFSKRSTVGFIRVGSRVWGKALNGDFYKGIVTGLGQMIHIKFDNGDTIAHDRNDPECVVFDVDPDPSEIQIGTRVIAHWPTLPAYLAGNVIGMEHHKYYVQYDDGDKHHNEINHMRLLKPPVYFGPGSDIRKAKLKKKSESMKVTSLTGKAVITTELPRKISGLLAPPATSSGVSRSSSLPTNLRPNQADDKQSSNTLPAGTSTLLETNIDSGTAVNHLIKTQSDCTSQSSLRNNLVMAKNAPCVPDFEDNANTDDGYVGLDAQRTFPVYVPSGTDTEGTKQSDESSSQDRKTSKDNSDVTATATATSSSVGNPNETSNNNSGQKPSGRHLLVTDL